MKTNSSSDAVLGVVPDAKPVSRRGFLSAGAALAGASGAVFMTPASALGQDSQHAAVPKGGKAPAPARITTSSDSGAVVETQYGKIRGAIRHGIYSFKGVPYGADTGGPNRWMMAKAPTPWAGVKSTTCYTHTCPMIPRAGWNNDEERFIYDWSDGIPGEDVLNLSVWTPGINDNRKRAVSRLDSRRRLRHRVERGTEVLRWRAPRAPGRHHRGGTEPSPECSWLPES